MSVMSQCKLHVIQPIYINLSVLSSLQCKDFRNYKGNQAKYEIEKENQECFTRYEFSPFAADSMERVFTGESTRRGGGQTRESLHGRVRVVIYNSDSEIRKNFNTRTRSAKLKILRTLQDQGELLTTRKNIRDLTLIPLRFRVQLTIDKMITEVSQTQSLDKTNMLVNHMGHNDKEGRRYKH